MSNGEAVMSGVSLPAARAGAAGDGRLMRHPATLAPFLVAVVILALATLPLERAVVGAFGAMVLIVLSAVDIERGIIPNRIVLPSFGVVLVAQLALFPGQALEWLLAAIIAAVVLLLPHLVRGAWMGMGDVKLALLIGALLGWSFIGAFLLAFLCTFPVALLVLARGGLSARKSAIPFGPFLSLGALIVLFGPHLAGFATG
jgi:leader peptidase (prepilin peptidase) / N-methyltransferase